MITIVRELKTQEKQKALIDNEIKSLKLERDYKSVTEKIKDLKNKLYEAMLDDEISFYEGYELSKLLPANEKKEIKRQQKIEKFSQVLSKEIDTEQETVNDLAEKLSVI